MMYKKKTDILRFRCYGTRLFFSNQEQRATPDQTS